MKLPFFVCTIFSLLFSFELTAQIQGTRPDFSRDNINATLWQQYSGEYKALAYQAYNLAKLQLDKTLMERKSTKSGCIIVDIDETVLDNSPFEGYEIQAGKTFDFNDWNRWASMPNADTIPGAVAFLNYVASKNIEVFYITNRDQRAYQSTFTNLKKFNFPCVDEKHLLVKTETSDKEPRRKKVAENYEILMLCGDNLNDFSNDFYKKSQDERAKAVEKSKALFGKYYIVLPNPMYGDWEPPLYDNKKGLTEQEKAGMRLNKLKRF